MASVDEEKVDGAGARRAAAMLQAICEASVEGIVLHERGIIVSGNAAAAAMFGYAVDELAGRTVLEFIAPDQVEMVRANYESALEVSYEAAGLRKDGTRFPLQARTRNVAFGDGSIRAVVLRDLSELEAAARQQAATDSLLRATLDATADGILVVDMAGRLTLCNARFLEIWRLPSDTMPRAIDEAMIEHAARQLIDPVAFRARIRAAYERPNEESVDTLEFHDGRFIERHCRPQRVGDGIIGRVWSFQDVTAHRRAERTLERAVQMRDEFLGVASHELYTPITSLALAIRGLREAAVAESPGPTQGLRDRLHANAARQVERLARLVQELLDVTRLDAGRVALVLESVDLGDVAREVVERFAPQLERDAVSVTLESAAPVMGTWDRLRLEQVVTNLLSNAIKFGQGRPIELAVRSNEGLAELSITDHGIGIELDQQTRIFERFQRAVSANHFAGLGLGLYITRQLVEAHGGELRVVSEPDRGATFVVRLPLSPAPRPVST